MVCATSLADALDNSVASLPKAEKAVAEKMLRALREVAETKARPVSLLAMSFGPNPSQARLIRVFSDGVVQEFQVTPTGKKEVKARAPLDRTQIGNLRKLTVSLPKSVPAKSGLGGNLWLLVRRGKEEAAFVYDKSARKPYPEYIFDFVIGKHNGPSLGRTPVRIDNTARPVRRGGG